jgi:predicted nucleic acid-binding protein
MACLDANVWIYFLDADLDEHEAVSESVGTLLSDRPLFTTTVIQMEVVHYLSNQLVEPGPAIERFLHVSDTTVASLAPADVSRAADLLQHHEQAGIGGRDATIIAAMERREASELWTHDTGLKRLGERLDWLTVVDPVEESP